MTAPKCNWVCDVCRKVTTTEDEPCDCEEDDFDHRLATIENAIIAEKNAHLERLLAELAAARPIVTAAMTWFRAEHCFDSECAAGEHDRCPARVAEEALRAVVEAALEARG